MDLSTPTEPPLEPGMLDYTSAVGGFLFWSPKGQLFALNRFIVSRDFSKILPQDDRRYSCETRWARCHG